VVTEVLPGGELRRRQILAAELRVTTAGALEAVEPLSGQVAVCRAPGMWWTWERGFVTYGGRYEDDDPGNYPHGRVIESAEG
jgi:hypothetical protein